MFQRRISKEEVKRAVVTGETIEIYPTDKPFGERPLHVVAADDTHAQETIIITVYQPDISEWEAGFKRRKPQ